MFLDAVLLPQPSAGGSWVIWAIVGLIGAMAVLLLIRNLRKEDDK